jgi:hypothetical protein
MKKLGISLLFVSVVFFAACKKGPDDATIASGVKSAMFSDPVLKNADVSVAVQNGEVTLTGTVKKESTRDRAGQVAQSVLGVTKVYDNLEVPGTASAKREIAARSSSDAAPPPPPPPPITIPAGTVVAIRTIDKIDSAVNRTGETFRASVDRPVVVEGDEVCPRGRPAISKVAVKSRCSFRA